MRSPPSSHVGSGRQRLTTIEPQRSWLPALGVNESVSRPLESWWEVATSRSSPLKRRSTGGVIARTLGAASSSSRWAWTRRDVTRSSFLEQQGRCAHHRLGVEAVSHQPVQDRVVDPDDGHSLVVCHVAADEGVAVVT